MYSEIPEIKAEQLSQGDLHMGLVADTETHRYMLQLIINSNVSVHPDHRCKQILRIIYLLEKDAVTVGEIKTEVCTHSVEEFPVSQPVYADLLVILPYHGEYDTLVAVT